MGHLLRDHTDVNVRLQSDWLMVVSVFPHEHIYNGLHDGKIRGLANSNILLVLQVCVLANANLLFVLLFRWDRRVPESDRQESRDYRRPAELLLLRLLPAELLLLRLLVLCLPCRLLPFRVQYIVAGMSLQSTTWALNRAENDVPTPRRKGRLWFVH